MEKKEEILRAACALLAREGYAFSMSELAQRVGMRTPSLYSHYKSKDEIVEKAVCLAASDCRRELEAYVESLSGRGAGESLELIFRRLLDYFAREDRARLWKNMLLLSRGELREKCREELEKENRWFTLALSRLFGEGAARGELRPQTDGSAYLYFVMVQGLLDVMLLMGGDSDRFRDYAERVWRTYWDGVKAP